LFAFVNRALGPGSRSAKVVLSGEKPGCMGL